MGRYSWSIAGRSVLLLFETLSDGLRPNLVALRAEMQPVFDKKVRIGLAGRIEHGRPKVDVFELSRPVTVPPHKLIRLESRWGKVPARRARFDRKKVNRCPRQGFAQLGDEGFEVLENSFRAQALRDVIVAGVEENFPRLIGDDDAFGQRRRIGDDGTAKPPPYDLLVRKAFGEVGPEADARTSDEENRSFGRGIGSIASFKRLNVLVPAGGRPIRGVAADAEEAHQQEQCALRNNRHEARLFSERTIVKLGTVGVKGSHTQRRLHRAYRAHRVREARGVSGGRRRSVNIPAESKGVTPL